MSAFSDVEKLERFLEESLANFESVHAKYLFYTAVKEQVSLASGDDRRVQYSQLGEDESVAEISRIENEKDAHYVQTIQGLEAEIAMEHERSQKLRSTLQQSLLESTQNAHSEYDLHEIEEECSKIEQQLAKYAEAEVQISQLNALKSKQAGRSAKLEEQIKHVQESCQRCSAYEQQLRPQHHDDGLRESVDAAHIARFIKALSR